MDAWEVSDAHVSLVYPSPAEVIVTLEHPGEPLATPTSFTVGEIKEVAFFVRIPPKTSFPMRVIKGLQAS
jgi:hypothetical protein